MRYFTVKQFNKRTEALAEIGLFVDEYFGGEYGAERGERLR